MPVLNLKKKEPLRSMMIGAALYNTHIELPAVPTSVSGMSVDRKCSRTWNQRICNVSLLTNP